MCLIKLVDMEENAHWHAGCRIDEGSAIRYAVASNFHTGRCSMQEKDWKRKLMLVLIGANVAIALQALFDWVLDVSQPVGSLVGALTGGLIAVPDLLNKDHHRWREFAGAMLVCEIQGFVFGHSTDRLIFNLIA